MAKYKWRLEHDEDARNPRKEFDHFATIACVYHRNYNLGDIQLQAETIEEMIQDDSLFCLPVFAYEHSTLSLSVSDEYPFNQPWDAGIIGIIYATKADIREEYKVKRISPQTRTKVIKLMQAEIKEYSAYLSGDVYGWVIYTKKDNHVDSCWGYYGHEYAEERAREECDERNRAHKQAKAERKAEKKRAKLRLELRMREVRACLPIGY